MNKKIVVAILLLCAALSMGCLEEKQTYVQEVVEESINETISESTIIPIQQPIIEELEVKEYNKPVYDSYYYQSGDYVYVFYRVINGYDNNIIVSGTGFSFQVNGIKYTSVYVSIRDRIILPGEDIRFRATYRIFVDDVHGQSIYTPNKDNMVIHYNDSVLNDDNVVLYDFDWYEITDLNPHRSESSLIYVGINYTIMNNCSYSIQINPKKWILDCRSDSDSPDEISYTDEFSGTDKITILPQETFCGKLVFETHPQERGYYYLKYILPYSDMCMIWWKF